MSSSKIDALDVPIREYNRKRPGGDFGIEIELEGSLSSEGPNKYWTVKPEGSLRDGIEYVLARPTKLEELDDALAEFAMYMKGSKPKKTIRCSTHFHINVCSLTQRQLYNVLGYYFLIEELLVRSQGPMRIGNLFCLRMSDAEHVFQMLHDSITSKEYFSAFGQNQCKYGAINLAAPLRWGSLEFRFFRPMTDTSEIKKWAMLLYSMIHGAAKIPINRSCDLALASPSSLLNAVFSKKECEFILEPFAVPVHPLVLQNYDYIQELSSLLEKRSFIRLAPHEIATDLQSKVPPLKKTFFETNSFPPAEVIAAALAVDSVEPVFAPEPWPDISPEEEFQFVGDDDD